MEINELNYELYALDYAEGKMSGEELQKMEVFLQKNPVLKAEILEICSTILPQENEFVYAGKESLIKKPAKVQYLKIAFAFSSAACILLAFGFLSLLSKQNQLGELAHSSIKLNIETNVTVIQEPTEPEIKTVIVYQEVKVNSVEKEQFANTKEIKPIIQDLETLAIEENFEIKEVGFDKLKDLEEEKIDENVVFESIDNNEIIVNNEVLESEIKNESQIEIDMDKQQVEVEAQSDLAINEVVEQKTKTASKKDKLSPQKQARRKLIKQGAWGVFQQAFIPDGVVSLATN